MLKERGPQVFRFKDLPVSKTGVLGHVREPIRISNCPFVNVRSETEAMDRKGSSSGPHRSGKNGPQSPAAWPVRMRMVGRVGQGTWIQEE